MFSYFTDKKILVLCSGNTTRSMIRNTLLRFGADSAMVIASKSYRESLELMRRNVFDVVIVDYIIDDHFGLELAMIQKEQIAEDKNRIFVIVADSGEASAVADSAEGEVDAFLIKPLSEEILMKYIQQIVRGKEYPSEQAVITSTAKNYLMARDFEALEKYILVNLMNIDKPATAYSYLGQSRELQGKFVDALNHYETGLSFNFTHFKCLSGKFQMHYRLGQRNEAYEVVQKIKRIYPLTPEVLKTAFCVVIETYNFKEVEEYYQLYLRQARKPDDLKFIVSTALLTAGKALLRRGDTSTEIALNYFCKGSVISGRQGEYIENVINELIRLGHVERVNKFFDMFRPGEVKDNVIRPLRFRQYMREKREVGFLLNEGKKMIFDGAVDEPTVRVILAMAQDQAQDLLLESLANKAIELFPENRQFYVQYMS